MQDLHTSAKIQSRRTREACRAWTATRGSEGSARLAGGEHDRVPEELEGDGAEEALGRAGLHGRGVQVALAEAVVPCIRFTECGPWCFKIRWNVIGFPLK